MRLGFSICDRRLARRVAMVDTYELPSSVRERLRLKHPQLPLKQGDESIALVETATRQWFRIVARHPGEQLSMPSSVVDDFWREFLLHTRRYAAFRDAAFGRFLHYEPKSAMSSDPRGLLVTLRLAREDEDCGSDALPLLFRVDSEVGLPDARCYTADCDDDGECKPIPSLVCLRHLFVPLPSWATVQMIGHHAYVTRRGGHSGCG